MGFLAPLLSYREAASVLGVSKATFGRIVESGELPVVAVSPGRRLVDPADLRDFIDARKLRLADLQNDDGAETTAPTVRASGAEIAGHEPG